MFAVWLLRGGRGVVNSGTRWQGEREGIRGRNGMDWREMFFVGFCEGMREAMHQ